MVVTRKLGGGTGARCVTVSIVCCRSVRDAILRVKIQPRLAPPQGCPLVRRTRPFLWIRPWRRRKKDYLRKRTRRKPINDPSPKRKALLCSSPRRLQKVRRSSALTRRPIWSVLSCWVAALILEKRGSPPAQPFAAPARFKFANGRSGRVRSAAEIPAGLAGCRREFTAVS